MMLSTHNRQTPTIAAARGSERITPLRWAIVTLLLIVCSLLAISTPTHGQTQIARTKHNLSVSGPGTLHTTDAQGTCIFCHTQHNASATRGLWNRELPPVTYQIYASSTLQATPDQPTGSSRFCLSCHDGILALGNLRVPPKGGSLSLGALAGGSLLGTNLTADHPVSFTYDSALALKRGDLADPQTLPRSIRLDDKGQMQCTSCHDPHDDRQPKFLRMDNVAGALCVACHRPRNWSGSVHATATATWSGIGTNPWVDGAPPTVAQNACQSCHRPHAAGQPQRLLAQTTETATCTVCHSGNVAAKNVELEFQKPLHHPIEINQGSHEPRENALTMPRHVGCTDCHNPHAATTTPGAPPAVSGRLRGVSGITLGGASITEANFEHEVCAKCHGLREPSTPGITRQSGTRNIRVKIQPGNLSYHPVATSGMNPAILGLEPGYTSSSVITCSSCHTNDDWTPGGTSPRGPHGSRYEPILGWQYQTNDPTMESYQNFALCYQCHNRSFLLNDQAGTFPHKRHVTEKQVPCAACHDAHGSRQNAHLVDFMLRDRSGKAVVTPSSSQRRLEYISLGAGRGQCYLQCHGVNHEPKSYP